MDSIYSFNVGKNATLQKTRSVSFEMILDALINGGLVDEISHPNRKRYPKQTLLLVRIGQYVYVVPCVKTGDTIFMKTIYPSRKYTKMYLGGNK